MDFHQLITEPQYLDWDIDSTNVKLNTDKGVWCLLVSRFATRGPPQHSTRCHRNRACCEDNKTATMATTGGVTRKPGSHRSSSKHDTCALKVKNIHRLNARYWTWVQRLLCLWVGCLQSSGWPLQFFLLKGWKINTAWEIADLTCMVQNSGWLHTCLIRI